MHRLYGYPKSANCYKVQLLFHQLRMKLELVEVDIEKGQTHTPEFRAINPLELTPALEEVGSGRQFAESNAILWYVARYTGFGPTDGLSEYETLKWMMFEQNLIEPNIGRARRLLMNGASANGDGARQVAERQKTATTALGLLDAAIDRRQFLVDDRYSIADIAMYAYAHLAPQAGIGLDPFGNVRRWLSNVEATPRFRHFSHA